MATVDAAQAIGLFVSAFGRRMGLGWLAHAGLDRPGSVGRALCAWRGEGDHRSARLRIAGGFRTMSALRCREGARAGGIGKAPREYVEVRGLDEIVFVAIRRDGESGEDFADLATVSYHEDGCRTKQASQETGYRMRNPLRRIDRVRLVSAEE